MNSIRIAILGVAAVMVAGAASAQAKAPSVPNSSQMTTAPYVPPGSTAAEAESQPLFTIGHMDVDVWAPVEVPYDPNMNRNQAANPIWGGN